MEMGISHSTVQTHVASLRSKLQLGTVNELIAYAARSTLGHATPEVPMPNDLSPSH